ncbi:MAG: SDR family NAD(P)-dependent oxidoreductase [Agathobaculum sp.]|uniref:SDR family NAD(P)-dependent oxidoreductase n=1 Tax=Agathobaculum sp. TaxID=2048138 RepID=UPI003D8E3AC9
MELGLKNKVVVITGGSQGIGRAAALEFAREGCKVCVCARRMEKLEQLRADFAAEGFDVLTFRADVAQYDELEAFADAVIAAHGRIDIWINNAAVNQYKLLLDYDAEEFNRIVRTDLTAVFSGSKIAAQRMIPTGGGVILQASSYSSITPSAGRAPYAACKSGVMSLTRTMAAEFAPYHIRVAAYIPGMIRTELTAEGIAKYGDAMVRDVPMKRLGEPEDLAKAIVFLASDQAAGYINGVGLEISGAKRCVQNPWYAYDVLQT